MKKTFFAALLMLLIGANGLFAIPFGYTATSCTKTVALDGYTAFKGLYFDSSCGGKTRVKWGHSTAVGKPDETVSEGVAYGMIMAAYADDQSSFNGLWNYYKSFPNANGLMHWHTSGCSNVIEQNAATDAEEDAAIALVLAHYKWGSAGSINYSNDAKWLIGLIKSKEVDGNVLKPGDMFGGASLTNISYFAPGYYKVFGEFTNDGAFWNGVADKCYEIINNNLNNNNAAGGLTSDWCGADGRASSGKATFYSYDACRTPWRIAVDYLWYGDTRAKAYLDKTNAFITKVGGITEVKDGYNQDGTLIAGTRYHNTTFLNTFACAGVATNQATVDAYYTEMTTVKPWGYFDYCFDVFGKYMLSGFFSKPGTPSCTDNVLSKIKITATKTSLAPNEVLTLTATGESSCQAVPVPNLTWSTNAPGGVFKSGTKGDFRVTATSGNITSEILITVKDQPLSFKIEAESYTAESTVVTGPYDKVLAKENGGMSIGYYNNLGETVTYSVTVPVAGEYDVIFKYASDGVGTLGLKVGNGSEQVLNFAASPKTINWYELAFAEWPLSAVSKITLPAGAQTITIVNKGVSINLDYFELISNASTSLPSTSKANIEIFPNPSNGVFTINANNIYTVDVYDIVGNKILAQVIDNSNNTIDLGGRKGLFLLKFYNNTESFIERVVVK